VRGKLTHDDRDRFLIKNLTSRSIIRVETPRGDTHSANPSDNKQAFPDSPRASVCPSGHPSSKDYAVDFAMMNTNAEWVKVNGEVIIE